jgi:hypothetical protein
MLKICCSLLMLRPGLRPPDSAAKQGLQAAVSPSQHPRRGDFATLPPRGRPGRFGTPLARRTQAPQHRDTERARRSIKIKTSTKK